MEALGAAPSWRLMGSASLMGGQYFFEDTAGSLNGYAHADLQLARSFSSDCGFYLTGRSAYSGFKQVNELAGGGTLFQQSLDSAVGAKWIKRFGDGYSLKPRVAVRNQLFRETKDEDWGKGLYDFWRYEAGLVWERKTRLGVSIPWTYQFSYDLYYTRYARFKTLTSQFGAELGAPDPGARVLDTVTSQLGYRSEFDLPGFSSAWLFYSLSLVQFTDQKVVNSQGAFLNATRSDTFQTLGLGYAKRLLDVQILGRVRPSFGVAAVFSDLMSNQNHYDSDPARLKFVGAYYDYWEARLSPSASALFLTPMLTARAGYDLALRYYTGRLAQTQDGGYTGSKLRQVSHAVWLETSYPLVAGLDLKARGTWATTAANTDFEQTYQYSYTNYNYFAGVEWRFQ